MANPEDRKPEAPRQGPPNEQNPNGPPIVIAPHHPEMEKVGQVKTVMKDPALPLMGTGAPASDAGQRVMAPVPPERSAGPSAAKATPQEPKQGPSGGAPSEGYARVEIHVEDGQLSVIGIKEVPGPLVNPNTVARGYVYEVLINDQQIALGSIPDVGVRRAFANRDVPGPQGKHYFVKAPTFDFFARIPKTQLSAANLPKLNIVLHNVAEAPDRFTAAAPLAKQANVEATEVGRLSGIRMEALPQAVRPQFEAIVKENDRSK